MTLNQYRLHGLVVESRLPLAGTRLDARQQPDIEIGGFELQRVADSRPEGEVIAEELHPPYSFFIAERDGQYVVRYGSTCELRVAADGRRIDVVADPSYGAPMASVILSAGGVSFAAMLLGHCVLHASGVVVADKALLSLGDPQSGKTTLATELVLAGGALLGDDAIRVDLAPEGPIAYPAGQTLRLRPSTAVLLAPRFGTQAQQSVAPDGRVTLRPQVVAETPAPVAAVLVNCPDDSVDDIVLEPLDERSALIEAVRHIRTAGFVDGRMLGPHFDQSARLARAVRFVRLRRPPHPLEPERVRQRLAALVA